MATETRVGNEDEIASKKIQFGRKNYYVDLKENKNGKFIKFVEVLSAGKVSRIVIPMSVASEFLEKLIAIRDYIDTYEQTEKTTVEKSGDRFASIIKSQQLFVLNRRFYFDLKESFRGKLILRISLVSNTNRINVSLFAEVVSAVVTIIEEFIKDHPTKPAVAPTYNARRPNRNLPKADAPVANSQEVSTPKSEKTPRVRKERVPKKQLKPLLVLSDPAPEVFNVDGRSYTFELVSGEEHTFVRVCEQKSFRKSTMHIPIELCDKWMETCGAFVKSIPASAIEEAMKNKPKTVASSS